MDGLCFANVAENSWLKMKEKEGKYLQGSVQTRASGSLAELHWAEHAGEAAGPCHVTGLQGQECRRSGQATCTVHGTLTPRPAHSH